MTKKIIIILFISHLCISLNMQAQNRQDTVKILAIGNSFSDDGTDYLDEIAKAANVPIVVGNLYIGGCSLERHWNNIQEEKADYVYRKNKHYEQVNTKNVSIQSAIKDEDWDFVTVQQVSQNSGMMETYYPFIVNILDYVKENTNVNVQIAFHQTWAYAETSTHSGFKNYDNSQKKMYKAIMKTVKKVTKKERIPIVIPSGTAIQNMRGTMGDILCRDGFHLSMDLGRYTAACVWFETLCKRSAIGNNFRPEGVSPESAKKAQTSAHQAIKRPYKVASAKKINKLAAKSF